GVSDCTSAIWAAGAINSPTCGAIRPMAFNSAPATAQCSHCHPASGFQDRCSTSMTTVRIIAQDTNRIATNSSGVRCCNPIFPVIKEELQSMTNKKGASLTNITIPVAGDAPSRGLHDRAENAASIALRVLTVSLL